MCVLQLGLYGDEKDRPSTALVRIPSMSTAGLNANGQLGDGTTTDRPFPVPSAPGRKYASIFAGPNYTCGLKADGTMECWGEWVWMEQCCNSCHDRMATASAIGVQGAKTLLVCARRRQHLRPVWGRHNHLSND